MWRNKIARVQNLESFYFWNPLNWYCWLLLKLEKKSSKPAGCGEGEKPDIGIPRPDPDPIALPMEYEGGGPFSLSSDPSLSPPTIPTSVRDIFLAVTQYTRKLQVNYTILLSNYHMRKKKTKQNLCQIISLTDFPFILSFCHD